MARAVSGLVEESSHVEGEIEDCPVAGNVEIPQFQGMLYVILVRFGENSFGAFCVSVGCLDFHAVRASWQFCISSSIIMVLPGSKTALLPRVGGNHHVEEVYVQISLKDGAVGRAFKKNWQVWPGRKGNFEI